MVDSIGGGLIWESTIGIDLELYTTGFSLGCEVIKAVMDNASKLTLKSSRVMAKEKALANSFLLGAAHNRF